MLEIVEQITRSYDIHIPFHVDLHVVSSLATLVASANAWSDKWFVLFK